MNYMEAFLKGVYGMFVSLGYIMSAAGVLIVLALLAGVVGSIIGLVSGDKDVEVKDDDGEDE